MFDGNWHVGRIKEEIARQSRAFVENIKLYKVIHLELDDDARVRDVANTNGATYLSAYTTSNNFEKSTLNLLYESLGESPLHRPTPQPPQPGEWDPQPFW